MEEELYGVKTFYAESSEVWRDWLKKNWKHESAIWLIVYHKNSNTPSVHFRESIEDAVCYGWVDSKAIQRDKESFYLRFTPRNPNSKWGVISRKRAEKMIEEGKMRPPGQAMIDLAKETGRWDVVKEAQNIEMPEDLKTLFDKNKLALKNFESFPSAAKKGIIDWIREAKRPDTRLRRIRKTVEIATQNKKPNY